MKLNLIYVVDILNAKTWIGYTYIENPLKRKKLNGFFCYSQT